MSLTADKTHLMINGLIMPINRLTNIPQGIPVMDSAAQPIEINNLIKNNDTGGSAKMEIKTAEELRNAFPDLIQQIANEAKTEGIKEGANQEKERLKAIEEIENKIDNKDLIFSAKFGEKPMNASELAFEALKAQRTVGAAILHNIDADAQAAGTNNVQATPNAGNEELDPENKAKEVMNIAIEAFKAMNEKGGTK